MDEVEEIRPNKPTVKKNARDAIFGFGMTAVAAVLLFWGIPESVVTPASVEALPLSPAFLPYSLTGAIGVLGLICGIQALLGPGVPTEEDEGFHLASNWPIALLALTVVLAAFCYLPAVIGMLGVSIFAMMVLVWIGGETSAVRGLLVSILVPLFVYLFFVKLAQVPLPQGILEGWI